MLELKRFLITSAFGAWLLLPRALLLCCCCCWWEFLLFVFCALRLALLRLATFMAKASRKAACGPRHRAQPKLWLKNSTYGTQSLSSQLPLSVLSVSCRSLCLLCRILYTVYNSSFYIVRAAYRLNTQEGREHPRAQRQEQRAPCAPAPRIAV